MKLMKILTFVAVALLLTSSAMAQKFGFVDSERIQNNYKEWVRAQDQFNTELQAWEDQASEMEKDLRDMVNEYDKQKLILSAEKKAEREAAITAKQQALQAFTRQVSGPGGQAEQRMQELVKPLYERIQAAIEQIAIEGNYDFIFNSEGLAYARQELDVTDKVLEILESGE